MVAYIDDAEARKKGIYKYVNFELVFVECIEKEAKKNNLHYAKQFF